MVRIPENVRRVCFILFVVVLSYATTAQPSRPSFLVKTDSIAEHNPADAIEYLLFQINNGYQNQWEEAQTLQTMAGLYGSMSLTDQATMYYLEAAGLFRSLEMLKEEAVCYSNMGFLKLNLSQYKEGVEFYHKSAAIYEFEIDDKAGLSHSWANIGNIYFILEDYDRALQYASKSNELAADVASTAVENYSFKLLGMIYRKQGRYTEAEELYLRALSKYTQASDISNEAEVLSSMANLFYDQGQFRKSIQTLRLAYSKIAAVPEERLSPFIFSALGFSYVKLNQIDSAVYFLQQSMEGAHSIKNIHLIIDGFRTLQVIERNRGNYKLALDHLDQYMYWKDSLQNSVKIRELEELEAKYQNTVKEREIELLKLNQNLQDEYLQQQMARVSRLTILFFVLILIAAFLFHYFGLRNKIKRQQELERMRLAIARDLHDDIGSALSSIQIISRVSRQNEHDYLNAPLAKIESQAARVMDSLSDIVWSLKAEESGMDDIIARMREFGAEITEAAGIQFEVSSPAEITDLSLDIEKRKNMYLIFKEAINNAVKYSNASKVSLEFELKSNHNLLTMGISDNGCGFCKDEIKAGNGIRNMEDRIKKIGGEMILEVNKDQGVALTFSLPIT